MRSLNVFTLFVVAGFFLAAAAQAHNAPKCANTTAARIVYRGKDSAGRTLFLLTVVDPHAVTLSRSPRAEAHRSRMSWTSLIGSGRAAAQEEKR